MKVVKVHRYILQLVQSPSADTGGYTRLCRRLRMSGVIKYNACEAMHGDPTSHASLRAAGRMSGRVARTISLYGCRRVYTSASVFSSHGNEGIRSAAGGSGRFEDGRDIRRRGHGASIMESENNQSPSTGAGGPAYPLASEPSEQGLVQNTRRRVWILGAGHGGPTERKVGSVSTGRVMNLSGLEHVLSDKECYLNITRTRREVW